MSAKSSVIKLCVSLSVALTLCACAYNRSPIAAEIDRAQWQAGKSYEVIYENIDPEGVYEISVFVVHNSHLADRVDSLPLTITTQTPDSIVYSESWVIYPDPSEEHSTSVWHETKMLYRSNVVFAEEGDYVFAFEHKLPQDLKGVAAIGVDITDVTNNDNGKR